MVKYINYFKRLMYRNNLLETLSCKDPNENAVLVNLFFNIKLRLYNTFSWVTCPSLEHNSTDLLLIFQS